MVSPLPYYELRPVFSVYGRELAEAYLTDTLTAAEALHFMAWLVATFPA